MASELQSVEKKIADLLSEAKALDVIIDVIGKNFQQSLATYKSVNTKGSGRVKEEVHKMYAQLEADKRVLVAKQAEKTTIEVKLSALRKHLVQMRAQAEAEVGTGALRFERGEHHASI
jgi:hypothetical protein